MTTKILVPRASGEGGMGVVDNVWGEAYYDTGNFNKGLFLSGHNITQVIAETVTQGGLGGEWERNVLDIYYNGGNVGIGTTVPGAKLEVSINSNDIATSKFYNGGGSAPATVHIVDEGDVAGHVGLFVGNDDLSSAVLITKADRVGIGTASPNAPLHVSDAGVPTMNLTRKLNVLGSPNGAAAKIQGGALSNTTPSMGGAMGFALLDSDGAGPGTNTEGYLYFETKNSGASLTEKMRITSNGNVGIGTTNPRSTLDLGNGSTGSRQISWHSSPTLGYNSIWSSKNGARLTLANGWKGSEIFNNGFESSIDTEWARSAIEMGSGQIRFLNEPLATVSYGTEMTPNESMRIDSAGNVGIGTTNPGIFRLNVYGRAFINTGGDHPPSAPLFTIGANGYSGQFTGDNTAFYIGQNSASRSLILWSGSNATGVKLVANSNSWVPVTSDRRAKENISPLENVLEKVLKLSPSRFDFKEEYGNKDQIGFIAQDVNEVLPEFHIPGKTEEEMSTVKFSDTATTALLVKAIQEQQQLIEDLRSEVEALKNK